MITFFVQRWASQPLYRRLRWALWLPAGVAVAALAAAAPWPVAAGAGAAMVLLVAALGEPLVRTVRTLCALPLTPPLAEPLAAVEATPHGLSPEAISRALAAGDIHVQFRPLSALPSLRPCGLETRLQGLPAPEALALLPDAVLQAWLLPACQHFQRWLPALDRRGDGALWLQLSPELLAAPGLADALAQALARSGLGRERLRLCVHPVEAGRQAVLPEPARRLHQQGYTLVADGFGAGAASLAHLSQLPVRAVRLDSSLVERAGHGPAQRLVVESTARLAASLGMLTVADGLDSAVQAQALGMAGCRLGQGPLLGAWGPAEDWMPPAVMPDFADTA